MEVSRLGARCQLRWLNKETLNARLPLDENASFACGQNTYPIAYGKNLLFGTHGARFDGEGKVTELSETEVAELMEKLKDCKTPFSETPTDKQVDYYDSAATLKCYTPEAYRALTTRDACERHPLTLGARF